MFYKFSTGIFSVAFIKKNIQMAQIVQSSGPVQIYMISRTFWIKWTLHKFLQMYVTND